MATEVLFVDDEATTAMIVRRVLQNAGYAVTIAQNGLEALELLEKKHYPIVLTDWEMPEMDGAQLCKQIRRNFFGGYVYTILLTSRLGRDNVLEGLDAGADDYLTKPLDEAELLARLKTAQRVVQLESKLRKASAEAMHQATTDSLTEVYNRRYLMSELSAEMDRARRANTPVSVIMTDIDNFKTVNDRYGHQMGDVVLKSFATILSGCCRPNIDWVARYGGEEFVIVLPSTSLAGADVLAERMRATVEATLIEGERYSVNITASFGAAADRRAWPSPLQASETLLERADQCLYSSKRLGRNQVTLCETLDSNDIRALEKTFEVSVNVS
jgi:two-component system, cell cycle response regulator